MSNIPLVVENLSFRYRDRYCQDLTMRFIPTFARDFQLTVDAQRARGYELEKLSSGLIEQVRKMGPIFVPVVIHAMIGSEDIGIWKFLDPRSVDTLGRWFMKSNMINPKLKNLATDYTDASRTDFQINCPK